MDKHRKPPSPPTTHTNSSLPFLLFPRVPGQDLSRGLSPLIYSPTPVSKHRRKNKETLGFPIMVRKYTSLSSPLARGENDTFIPASGPTLRNITLLEKQKMGLHVDRRDAGIDVAGRGAVLSGAETKGVDLAIGKGVDEKGASVRLYEIRPQHRNSIASYPVVWLSLSDHSHSGFYEKCKNGDSVLEKEEWYIPLTRRSPHWDPLTEHPRVEAPRNSTVKHQRDNSGVFMGSESSSGKKNGTFASTTFTSPTILQKSPIQRPHALATRASSHDAATEAEISHLLTETASLLKRITKSSLAMQTLRTEKEELIDTVTQQNAEIEENDDQISELRQERRDQDLIRAVHVLHDLETQFTGRDAESSVLVEERRGEGDVLVRLVRSLEGIGLTDEETAELVDLQTECAGLVSETVHLTETIAILGAKTQHLGASHKDLEAELEHERKCTAILEAENGKLLSEGKEREVMGKEKHNLAIQKQNLAHGCHKFESLVEALETMLKTADFEIATQKARGNGLELRLAEETKRASDLVSAGKEFSVQNAQLVHALEALIEAIEDMESSMEMLEVQNVALKVEKGELVLENSMLGEEAKRLCEQIEEAQRERRALGMLVEVVAGMDGEGEGQRVLGRIGGLKIENMEKKFLEVFRDLEDYADIAKDFQPDDESGVESESENEFNPERYGLWMHGPASDCGEDRMDARAFDSWGLYGKEGDSAPVKTKIKIATETETFSSSSSSSSSEPNTDADADSAIPAVGPAPITLKTEPHAGCCKRLGVDFDASAGVGADASVNSNETPPQLALGFAAKIPRQDIGLEDPFGPTPGKERIWKALRDVVEEEGKLEVEGEDAREW